VRVIVRHHVVDEDDRRRLEAGDVFTGRVHEAEYLRITRCSDGWNRLNFTAMKLAQYYASNDE